MYVEPQIALSSDDLETVHANPLLATDKSVSNARLEIPGLMVTSSPAKSVTDQDTAPHMAFSSSPVLYPLSSSPAPTVQPKRKLFQAFTPKPVSPKKKRFLGGFELEDEDDENDQDQSRESADSGKNDAAPANEHSQDRIDRNVQPENEKEMAGLSPFDGDSERVIERSRIYQAHESQQQRHAVTIQTASGQRLHIPQRTQKQVLPYEQMIAARSTTTEGRAKKAYYGIDIHDLLKEAQILQDLKDAAREHEEQHAPSESVEPAVSEQTAHYQKHRSHQLWTEKYRARKFTELVGDERTHRHVLRWLKAWEPVVFPGHAKAKPKRVYDDNDQGKPHRKILLLTGPPGLGKTTLAHVCAKQAGYEALEINASDDRSRDVVRGRIKDALGTETVRGVKEVGKMRKAGRPVCVVVDEVDGVVSGSGGSGGEGGFMKALVDLVLLDQKNSTGQQQQGKGRKKGDTFRLKRPLILICNDVYAPSLRPLRQSSLAEIIHVRKPSIDKVMIRLKSIFERENIAADQDAVRRMCEVAWGRGSRKQNGVGGRAAGEGDIRGILVQGEWAAHKLRATDANNVHLTRTWVDSHLGTAATEQKGLGRGGTREVTERVFLEGAGLPNLPVTLSHDQQRQVSESKSTAIGVADLRKRAAISALREMIDTTGEHDRVMTECFATYPTHSFQDDTLLTKPNLAYDWLHFHDTLSTKVHTGQEWELNPYLSTAPCGFHHLFATIDKGSASWDDKGAAEEPDADAHPFAGSRADFAAYEAEKTNRAVLAELHSNFAAPLLRLYSSLDNVAAELVPNVAKMIAPDVKPVVVGGSAAYGGLASVRKDTEKHCVARAARVMHGVGIEFEKIRIEHEGGGVHSNGGFAMRMTPPLDLLSTYRLGKLGGSSGPVSIDGGTTAAASKPAPVRYSIRQLLSQELAKEKALQAAAARQNRVSDLPADTNLLKGNEYSQRGPTELEMDKENIPDKAHATGFQARRPDLQSAVASVRATDAGHSLRKDFFGRPVVSAATMTPKPSKHARKQSSHDGCRPDSRGEPEAKGVTTWVTFHEGYSNAVRKYISFSELMEGF